MHLLLTHSLNLALTLLPIFSWLTSVGPADPSAAPTASAAVQEVREEVNKIVEHLSPGAQVKVSGLNGGLKIETWNGNQAEIHITITASDREALARHPLYVEETGNGLTIRTEDLSERNRGRNRDSDDRNWGRNRDYVRHEAVLRLPSNINLNVSGINGGVEVGQITGTIAVSGINGGVNVAQAGRATKLSGINGRVSVAFTSIGEEGLHISGINGGVELRIPASINAELDVRGTNGSVNSEIQMTTSGEWRRGELRGTLGSGGPRIEVSGVNGGIHLKRF